MGAIDDFTTTVLRAVPVDLTLYGVRRVIPTREDETSYWAPTDDIETVGVVFTAGVIDSLIREFGSVNAWSDELVGPATSNDDGELVLAKRPDNPLSCVIRTLSIALHRDRESVSAAVIPGALMEYQAGLMTAIQIANGVDPTIARRMGQQVLSSKPDLNGRLAERLSEMEETDLHSKPGVGTGASQDEASLTSGV